MSPFAIIPFRAFSQNSLIYLQSKIRRLDNINKKISDFLSRLCLSRHLAGVYSTAFRNFRKICFSFPFTINCG